MSQPTPSDKTESCKHPFDRLLWYDGSLHCYACRTTWHKDFPFKTFCPACGTWGHTSGECKEIKPSSPTDKCREEFIKAFEDMHKFTPNLRDIVTKDHLETWTTAWQASRKECEEEKSKFVCGVDFAHDPRIRELQVENEQLRAELQQAKLDAMPDWERMYEDLRRQFTLFGFEKMNEVESLKKELKERDEQIASLQQELETAETNAKIWMDGYKALQSVVEAKDDLLRDIKRDCEMCDWSCPRCGADDEMTSTDLYKYCTDALQIDQLGGKKEEEK